jgi:3-oxoacyl-[acyl-carrier protein] reductase
VPPRAVSGPVDLTGKVAIVTGAARGIGLAVAGALAREGASVAAADLLDVGAAVEAVQRYGRAALGIPTDVSDAGQVEALVARTAEHFGGIDILVCSAGVYGGGDLASVDEAEWRRVLDVNLYGTYLCLRAVFPHLRARGGGKIVCVGSAAGKTGGHLSGPHYAASKGGVHAMCKWAAKHGAPDSYVNVLAPGAVATDMIRGEGYPEDISPLRRQGEAQDMAEGVLFLVSDASNYVTGTVLDVNGGYLMD